MNINENTMINQPLLLGAIDKILIKRSIAKRVSDIQPLKGPVGIVTGASWDRGTKKLKLAKNDVEALTHKIRTEFTKEALEDLQGIYKEDFYDVLAHYLIDDLAYSIDADFLSLIKNRAQVRNNLTFSASYDERLVSVGQSIVINIVRGLADLPISDNRSPNGWAVVTGNIAAILASTLNIKSGMPDESPSYIGRFAGVDFYIDYTYQVDGSNPDNVVYGIKGNGISKGSTIYSPYTQNWIETVDASTGEGIFFLLNRSVSSINPLDEDYVADTGKSGFLGKFNVDLSNLQEFN